MTRRKGRQYDRNGRERRLTVRGIRRAEPDYRKLGRALLALAQAEADAAAQSAATGSNAPVTDRGERRTAEEANDDAR
jgi:hypothetical protein